MIYDEIPHQTTLELCLYVDLMYFHDHVLVGHAIVCRAPRLQS